MIRARDNPFATERVERVLTFDPVLADTTWDELWERWAKCRCRAAVVGPHGAGKTTFLDAWKTQLNEREVSWHTIFLNDTKRELIASEWEKLAECRESVVLLDGVEQLGFRSRRRLQAMLGNAEGVLELRHGDGSLPTLLDLKPDPELMVECVRRVSARHAKEFADDLPRWWHDCGGNIREILLRCYDAVAERSTPDRRTRSLIVSG